MQSVEVREESGPLLHEDGEVAVRSAASWEGGGPQGDAGVLGEDGVEAESCVDGKRGES